MDDRDPSAYTTAAQDFRDARRRAALHDILARLSGKPADLLSFEETRKLIRGEAAVYRGAQEIPLKNVVGSVGRYRDFTRSFLPRREEDEARWARLKSKIHRIGFNPIEVYQIGQVYFVLDGNHRVSIARARGDQTIQATVTEIPTSVPLEPGDSPDDLIRKAERTDFFSQTRLDVNRPDTDFTTTAPGAYNTVNLRIARTQSRQPRMAWADAALRWHDEDYLPFVQLLRAKGLGRDFPGRTETDLYAWIIRRQDELEETIGWHVPLRVAAANLLARPSATARLGQKLSRIARPEPLEPGPAAGEWRRWALATHREDHLFTDYLVPISGSPQSWLALDQALLLAGMEQDFVHGLHVLAGDDDAEGAAVQALREEFTTRIKQAGVAGEMTVERGSITRKIRDYAPWVDLVILNIVHPPGASPIQKIASGIHTIIHRSPRPLILVPGPPSRLQKLLLAFDGSPKACEALYVAAYLVGKWRLGLVVLTAEAGKVGEDSLRTARIYLESRQLAADYHLAKGEPAECILAAAAEANCDTILMGAYGQQPVFEMVLGSTVDRVLRATQVPVFLCR